MGSVIFEAVPSFPGKSPALEWLLNFRVPAAGNDGGLIAVVNSRKAAEALVKVLNYATALHDTAVATDAAISDALNFRPQI